MGILPSRKPDLFGPSTNPFDSLDAVLNDRGQDDYVPPSTRWSQLSGSWSQSVGVRVLFPVVMVVAGFVLARFQPWQMFGHQELVYAYFELRAVDSSGRPIAGAVVKSVNKRVGTTDSFGEWRRYLRVPLGSTVPLTIVKIIASESLVATKNFAVPPEKPDHGEIEMRGSVQLLVGTTNAPGSNSSPEATPATTEVSTGGADVNKMHQAKINESKTEAKKESIKESIRESIKERRNEIKKETEFVSDYESIWFEASGPTNNMLHEEVLPALVQRAKDLGLHVDSRSPWKVRLSSLLDKPETIDKEGGGLILVSIFNGNSKNADQEFLRNYQSDPNLTARGILFVLAHETNKNVLITKKNNRWAAVLPQTGSDLWKLTSGQSLAGPAGAVTLSQESFRDGKQAGFYLQDSSAPCLKESQSCELKTRSFKEVPPIPTWTRVKLKTINLQPAQTKIFVSGYEAKLVGDNVYECWGLNNVRANVTIVHMTAQGGRVISRSQIISSATHPVPVRKGI